MRRFGNGGGLWLVAGIISTTGAPIVYHTLQGLSIVVFITVGVASGGIWTDGAFIKFIFLHVCERLVLPTDIGLTERGGIAR